MSQRKNYRYAVLQYTRWYVRLNGTCEQLKRPILQIRLLILQTMTKIVLPFSFQGFIRMRMVRSYIVD
jgi:hypothetical protein